MKRIKFRHHRLIFLTCACLTACQPAPNKLQQNPSSDALSEYTSPHFGVTIVYPAKVAKTGGNDEPVAIRVKEEGEVISFVREDQDAIVRHPYYGVGYENNPRYPAQIYVSKVATEADLLAFTKRAYGEDCDLMESSSKESAYKAYIPVVNGTECPGGYPPNIDSLLSVIRWDPQRKIAIGIQTGENKLYRPETDVNYSLNNSTFVLSIKGFELR